MARPQKSLYGGFKQHHTQNSRHCHELLSAGEKKIFKVFKGFAVHHTFIEKLMESVENKQMWFY